MVLRVFSDPCFALVLMSPDRLICVALSTSIVTVCCAALVCAWDGVGQVATGERTQNTVAEKTRSADFSDRFATPLVIFWISFLDCYVPQDLFPLAFEARKPHPNKNHVCTGSFFRCRSARDVSPSGAYLR